MIAYILMRQCRNQSTRWCLMPIGYAVVLNCIYLCMWARVLWWRILCLLKWNQCRLNANVFFSFFKQDAVSENSESFSDTRCHKLEWITVCLIILDSAVIVFIWLRFIRVEKLWRTIKCFFDGAPETRINRPTPATVPASLLKGSRPLSR